MSLREEIKQLVKEAIEEIELPQDGIDAVPPTKEELLELIRPLIPKVQNGKTPTRVELVKLIKPLIPSPIVPLDGKDGKDITGATGAIGESGKDAPTLEEILEALNKKGIEIENIKDFDKRVKHFIGGVNRINPSIQTIPSHPFKTVTADYSITADDFLIECDGTFTVTLPNVGDFPGKVYSIKNTGTGNVTVATRNNETIDGFTTKIITRRYDAPKIISNNSQWLIF